MLTDGSAVRTLDAMVAERNILTHTFYQEWSAGTLSRERLQVYAAQYYGYVAAFPRYLSAIHSRCDDLKTRQVLLENLLDEERGEDNHAELWLRFADAVGAPRERVISAEARSATRNLIDTYANLSSSEPIAAGLAALYVYESQIPAVATAKIEGLKRFYDVSDDRALSFFRVHEQTDIYHARAIAELVERHCEGEANQRAAIDAARTALDALWGMLDGL